MAEDREISDQLFLLCDTRIGAGREGVEAMLADMSRAELETVLAEAVDALLDSNERAEKEIERFQRRANERR